MIVYKDVITKLRNAGYSTTDLRRNKLLPESVLTSLRHNKPINTETLNKICKLTKLPVEELIEYIED